MSEGGSLSPEGSADTPARLPIVQASLRDSAAARPASDSRDFAAIRVPKNQTLPHPQRQRLTPAAVFFIPPPLQRFSEEVSSPSFPSFLCFLCFLSLAPFKPCRFVHLPSANGTTYRSPGQRLGPRHRPSGKEALIFKRIGQRCHPLCMPPPRNNLMINCSSTQWHQATRHAHRP